MMILRKSFALVTALVLAAGLVACDQKGPAEKAGEKIDKAAQNTKDAVQDTVQGQGPAEKAGEKIDKTLNGK